MRRWWGQVKRRSRVVLQVRMRGIHGLNRADHHRHLNVHPTLALVRVRPWYGNRTKVQYIIRPCTDQMIRNTTYLIGDWEGQATLWASPTGLTPEQETPHPKCEPQRPLTAPPKPAENPDAARGLEHVPSRASITPSENKRAPAPSLSVAVAQRPGRLPHRTLGEASIAATAAPTIDV